MIDTPTGKECGTNESVRTPFEDAASSTSRPTGAREKSSKQTFRMQDIFTKIDLLLKDGRVVRLIIFTDRPGEQHSTIHAEMEACLGRNRELLALVHDDMVTTSLATNKQRVNLRWEAMCRPDHEVPIHDHDITDVLHEHLLTQIWGQPAEAGGEARTSFSNTVFEGAEEAEGETPLRSIWDRYTVARLHSAYPGVRLHFNQRQDQDSVVIVAYEDQITEPPKCKFPTQAMITGDLDNSHVIPQQHVFLVQGEEAAAIEKVNALTSNYNARTHLQEGNMSCTTFIIRDRDAQQRALEIATSTDTPVISASIPGVPAKIGCISTQHSADPRRACGDLTQMPAQQVQIYQANVSIHETIRQNFFSGLLTLAQNMMPQLTGNPKYRRYAIEEAPSILGEVSSDVQSCDRCTRMGPIRVGRVVLAGRDLAEDPEEYCRTTRNMGLCCFCMRGWASDELFSCGYHLLFLPEREIYVKHRPDPLENVESKPGMLNSSDEDRHKAEREAEQMSYSEGRRQNRIDQFLQEHDLRSKEELDLQDDRVIRKFLLEAVCGNDEELFNKIKKGHMENVRVFIREMDVWPAWPKVTDNQRNLIKSTKAHLSTRDQEKYLTDISDCVALSTFRQQIITQRREAELQHPGISRWVPLHLFLKLAYRFVVQRETVLVRLKSNRLVRNAIQLETANADSALTASEEPLFANGIESFIKALRDTLDLRSTAESIPGVLYSIRYAGEDPLRYLESFSNLYATTVQVQTLFGSRVGALVYMTNLLRSIGEYNRALTLVIKRDLRDKGVNYDDITTDELAERHAQVLDTAVRTALSDHRRIKQSRDRKAPSQLNRIGSGESSQEEETDSSSEEDKPETSAKMADTTPPIGLRGPSTTPYRYTKERGKGRRKTQAHTGKRQQSPSGDRKNLRFTLPQEENRRSFFAVQQDSSSNLTTRQGKELRCYNCGKLGHYARDCRSSSRFKDQGSRPNKPLEYAKQLADAGIDPAEVRRLVAKQGVATKGLEDHTVAQLRQWEISELHSAYKLEHVEEGDQTGDSERETDGSCTETSEGEETGLSSDFDSESE